MLDTLQKMSGTTHKVFKDQRTITRDLGRLFFRNDDKVSESSSVKEVPVISYNDMAFIPMCNSIVFRAGDSPIWNRNQTCLPMSWRLFDNTIVKPGKSYSLQTIPTLSSAMDFDVRQNQPNFIKMWEHRRDQAIMAPKVMKAYADAYGYDDDAITRLDPDLYSDEVMEVVNEELAKKKSKTPVSAQGQDRPKYEENKDFTKAVQDSERIDEEWGRPIYANGLLSRKSLQPYPDAPALNHQFDEAIVASFIDARAAFANDGERFVLKGNSELYGKDGKPYIVRTISDEAVDAMQKAAYEKDTRVYTDGALRAAGDVKGFHVTDDFYRFLLSHDSWGGFASGKFELAMARRLAPES